MKVLQAVYRFIDERENGWTWIYFHILPVGFCTWFFLTLDYTSFAALGLSLLLPKSVVPLTLFCMAYFYQTGYMYYNSQYSKYWSMINPNTFIWVKDGVPGSGKSSSALVYAYIMSQKVWTGVRDSVAINEYMYNQEWVCRPALFLEIYDFIMRRV